MAWQVYWRVIVDGVDMTIPMRPYLISIEIDDKDGQAGDTCSLTFDDCDGQLLLPKDGASVEVKVNGVDEFKGTVDDVRSRGARGGGRTLEVKAKGFDARGKVKEPQTFHMDDASLNDFLAKAAKNAGLDAPVIDADFAAIARDYWAADSESFLHLGQRLARELGGTFKIRDKTPVLAKRGDGKTPSGDAMPTVAGKVGPGGNVISWDISPRSSRGAYTKAKVRYFDRASATYKTEEVEIESDRDLPDATDVVRTTAKDKDQAKQIADARKRSSERDGGEGTVNLDYTPEARAEGTFTLAGARPGVDGAYRIASVRKSATRSGGSLTTLSLKQPKGKAGTDSRKATTGKTSSAATSSAAASTSAPAATSGYQTGSGLLGRI